jgi:hypothetical protein
MFGLNRYVFPTFPFIVGFLVALAIAAFWFAKHSGSYLVFEPRQKIERVLVTEPAFDVQITNNNGDFEATNTYSPMHPEYLGRP